MIVKFFHNKFVVVSKEGPCSTRAFFMFCGVVGLKQKNPHCCQRGLFLKCYAIVAILTFLPS